VPLVVVVLLAGPHRKQPMGAKTFTKLVPADILSRCYAVFDMHVLLSLHDILLKLWWW
jgi:hypothetical protein